MSSRPVLDSVNESTLPFGLPAGSVRGILSLLICTFLWVVLLWPADQPIKLMLAHWFLFTMVLMAFASSPVMAEQDRSPFLPWLLRLLFVGGTVAVVAYVGVQHPDRLRTRLNPDPNEVAGWWLIFLSTTAGGFAFGLFARFVLGRANPIFRVIRAWLSVVGMLMLTFEIVLFVVFANSENIQEKEQFLRYWQCFELAIVSAYFGARA